jgi:membrane AbrB-like protein
LIALPPHVLVTLKTLSVGMAGMVVARASSFPIAELTGPALAVSIAGLWGMKTALSNLLRDIAFVVLGISIGAGMTAETTQMLLSLPLAFLAVTVATILSMLIVWRVLIRVFGFDVQSGLLAASPGHLSFVLSMGTQYDLDMPRITIVQSIRLLALTLLTPLAALAMGIDAPTSLGATGTPMAIWIIAVLAGLAYLASLILRRLHVPAPLLIGAMLVSMIGHGFDVTPGQMPGWMALPAFVVLGTLIGTRFGNVSLTELRKSAYAGGLATLITALIAFAFAIGTAWAIGLPLQHLLIAFAPGGLETMVAMSVALGITPGFVAACHLARLLVLSVVVPLLFARTIKRAK